MATTSSRRSPTSGLRRRRRSARSRTRSGRRSCVSGRTQPWPSGSRTRRRTSTRRSTTRSATRPPRRRARLRPPGSLALADALLDLQRLTERLRRDCPWDREQTARTIVPHTVEEAYEVADAAFADRPEKLLDELGDLLFQVYFLALLLEEHGQGDLEAVARGIHEKLVRRHPLVFGAVEARTAERDRSILVQIKHDQE